MKKRPIPKKKVFRKLFRKFGIFYKPVPKIYVFGTKISDPFRNLTIPIAPGKNFQHSWLAKNNGYLKN